MGFILHHIKIIFQTLHYFLFNIQTSERIILIFKAFCIDFAETPSFLKQFVNVLSGMEFHAFLSIDIVV